MSEKLINSITNLKICEKSFKIVVSELSECNKLPETVKEILNTAINSIDNFNEDNFKQLWVLLLDFMKDSLNSDDINLEKGLLECYQCILNFLNYIITSTKDASCLCGEEHLLKALTLFQSFYSKNFKYKFKVQIVKMCLSFWKLLEKSHTYVTIMNQYFISTFDYLFDTIKVTTKKIDMKTLSTSLWEFCKIATTLPSNQILMDIIVLQLEKCLKNTIFLETETGKLTIGDVFTSSQHLFLKLHQITKKNLPKATRLQAKAFGEIYFIAWINSNVTMREVIEQQGMFDIISRALVLQRTGLALHTYRSVLIFLQSLQTHRKHLMFSKVITKLYAPVLWRQLTSEFSVVRCNATEILARAYPLEKRGEGREESSRFLIKQQDAFLVLLEDPCPQVRIAAIKGVCSCLRYFWDSFEEDKISKCFWLFKLLMEESVFEVRRSVFYGLCQILDEFKSHVYFLNTSLRASMKNALFDENEKVRRAFIHVLLKIKKIDVELEQINKINFASIVNLHDAANALACEDKQNGLLITDLIFDNFIGEKVPDRSSTLLRFNMFYNINPTALRKLIIYSEKHLDFEEAYQYITALLKTLYTGVKKKEDRLKNINKENSIPAKRRKSSDESDMNDSSYLPCNTSSIDDDSKEKKEHSNVCCMLDCVNCLMILHRNKFMEESNQHLMKTVQDSCVKCIVKLVRFYKEGDPYFSTLSVASLIPVSKLSDAALPSSLLSTLKQLPQDIKLAEEEVDMRKVNCLVYTLCMWKRGHEILQFVQIWFDEAFKALDLNDSQYPEAIISEVKRVRFKTNFEECKPMTGILLINSVLSNLQTQKSLLNSDVNKKNMYDLILYLQRVKPAIEHRISSDNNLNKLLSDEVLIEMFLLKFRLHIIYHSDAKNVDEIINYQISTLDWVIKNLCIHNLHKKNKTTIKFAAKIVDAVNYIMMNVFLMLFINEMLMDNFITFCTTVLQNYLGPWVLLSITAALVRVTKHLNYLKYINKLGIYDMSGLTNCICNVITIFGDSTFDEERFTSVIGVPLKFRCQLTMLIMEIHKINIIEFKQVFTILIETVLNIIASRIREIDEVDLNEKLTELPFAAYQLISVILSNVQLRKTFSSRVNEILSSNVYKKEPVLLLSAISFIYTLSFNLNNKKSINLEPVVKLLYTMLMDHDKNTTLLGDMCSINNKKDDIGDSILETSDFSNNMVDFKQKGRQVLIATAKQLRITLID